jgi:hypothetical protein
VLASSLLELPVDAAAPGPGWRAQAEFGNDVVSTGTVFVPAAHRPAGSRLRIGAEGVREDTAAGGGWGVRWENCAALLRWNDGRRRFVHVEGMLVTVVPDMWADGARVPVEIDLAVPPDRVVDMPDDDLAWGPPAAAPVPRLSGLAAASTSFLVVLLAALTCTMLLLLSLLGDPEASKPVLAAVLALLAAGDFFLGRALVRRLRAPKAARSRYARERTGVDVRVDSALARASDRTALGIAVGAWALAAVIFIICAVNGAVVWPAIALGVFALRASDNYRRRRVR